MALSPFARYAFGVGVAAAAVLARLALEPFWGLELPFVLFFPAVMVSGWLGGLWPGISTTLLTAAAVDYFWLAPSRSWVVEDPTELLGLLVFVTSGVLISALNEAWRRGTARDVSARRTAERERERQQAVERAARTAAEESARQLALVLAAGHMGTWEYALDSGQVRWSPGLEAIHGYAPGTFPATFEAFQKEIHAEDRERVLLAIGEAVKERRDHYVEYRIVRTDGAVRWLEGRGQLFLDAGGHPQRMVGVCTDVTDRKQHEEHFQLAVEASPAAMLILDERGAVVYANALTEQMLGYSRRELVGQPVERLVPERWRGQHAGYRASFLARPERRPMGVGRELYARRKDGSELPVEIGLSPFTSADGSFVLAAVTDISERRQVEAERAALLEREREASRRKDEFLAILSHELRNPLAPLRNAAHILSTRTDDPAMTRAAHEVVERQLGHLVRLVDDLLDSSRVVQDRIELRPERLPLALVLESALEASRPLIEERRHRLTTSLPVEPLWLDADVVRLVQVFTNILNNAAKYTPEGGHIDVSAEQRDGSVVVRVRDDGTGMTAETVARLFELFFRDHAAGSTAGGLGIGLALAKRLVDLHGGTLAAASEGLGSGSEFTVSLPAAAPALPQSVAPAAEVPSSSRRVLVADDNVDGADTISILLKLAGHDVRTVYGGLAACEAALDFRPDVVLLDIGMPELDGYEVARRLRRQPGGLDMVLIALTGWGQDEDRQRTKEAGFSIHLTKPVDPAMLERLLSLPTPATGKT